MLRDMVIQIVDARIRRLVKPSTEWGTVTSTSPLRVRTPGDSAAVPVRRMDGVTVASGDRVLLLRVSAGWYVIGKVGT